jgi:hypothetical protein
MRVGFLKTPTNTSQVLVLEWTRPFAEPIVLWVSSWVYEDISPLSTLSLK